MCNRNNFQDNSKIGRDENVSLETLEKICEYFQCDIGDTIKSQKNIIHLLVMALCQILGRLIDLSLSFYVEIDICTFLFLYT